MDRLIVLMGEECLRMSLAYQMRRASAAVILWQSLWQKNLSQSYLSEYGVPVKIARLAQTFGQGALKDDTRVLPSLQIL